MAQVRTTSARYVRLWHRSGLQCRVSTDGKCQAGYLTAVSQTGETKPDSGVLTGHLVDPDLRIRTPARWPDALL
jgi:hypothetical protein